MRKEAHVRAQHGGSCYRSGRCRLPNSYLYDKEIIPRVRQFIVLVDVEGSHPNLMPDLTAAMDVELERIRGAVVVPRDAMVGSQCDRGAPGRSRGDERPDHRHEHHDTTHYSPN